MCVCDGDEGLYGVDDGSDDCLNLGGFARIECLGRRLAAIVEAHRRNPITTEWGSAQHIKGRGDPHDLISGELRDRVERRVKDENECESAA